MNLHSKSVWQFAMNSFFEETDLTKYFYALTLKSQILEKVNHQLIGVCQNPLSFQPQSTLDGGDIAVFFFTIHFKGGEKVL